MLRYPVDVGSCWLLSERCFQYHYCVCGDFLTPKRQQNSVLKKKKTPAHLPEEICPGATSEGAEIPRSLKMCIINPDSCTPHCQPRHQSTKISLLFFVLLRNGTANDFVSSNFQLPLSKFTESNHAHKKKHTHI